MAYSGGMDSHVLLSLTRRIAARLDVPVRAVHINHGLHAEADAWQSHCGRVCAGLGVPLQAVPVDASVRPGRSPEACARDARYQALRELLRQGEVLLFAHHQDDQAETFLLQLLRGAGPEGLAAMPRLTAFAGGRLFRPLLDIRRTRLREYAEHHRLQWIEDPSNRDTRYARNYLRHQVLPLLEKRWPGLAGTISRSARWCAQAAELVAVEGAGLLAQVRSARDPRCLDLRALGCHPPAQQALVVRSWLRQLGLDRPGAAHLEQILEHLVPARRDALPVVRWETTEVRRYRQLLYAFNSLPPPDRGVYHWEIRRHPRLELADAVLRAEKTQGRGLREAVCADGLEIRFRHGGERCVIGGGRHQALKKRFQQLAVPPWERGRLPLILLAGQVVAIADRWISPEYTAQDRQWGYVFSLQHG